MLLFIIFGVVVLVRKRVLITRSWTLTGERAVVFGSAMIVAPFASSYLATSVLPLFISRQVIRHPVFGRLLVIGILGAGLLLLAVALRDKADRRPFSP